MRETPFGAEEYLTSLALDSDGPVEVADVDGAVLYRVADEHFLVLACAAHLHRGHDMLLRVLPPAWVAFHQAFNPDDQFIATHYGPDLDEPMVP